MTIEIGTYDLLPFCNLDGQMAPRGSEFHFAPYHMEDENDCQAFRNALSSSLKQIPLQVDHDALIQRWCEHCTERCGKKAQNLPAPIWKSLSCRMLNGSPCVLMPEVEKSNSSTPTGKTAICRTWRVFQHSSLSNPILLLLFPRHHLPKMGLLIRRRTSQSAVSASHRLVGIRWERHTLDGPGN